MMGRTVVVLFSLLGSILQCHCYGPVAKNPVSVPSSQSENSVLNFGSAASDYGYVKPVAVVSESPKPANGYWWLEKQSPFVAVAEVPVKENVAPISHNEITGVKYESNPFINSFVKGSSCNGYDCVAKIPCVEEGYICVPQYLCQSGVIDKNQLSQVAGASKFCVASKEVCCKISYQYEGNESYEQKPSYTQYTTAAPTYSQPAVAVSVISSPGYSNPEYISSNSIAPTPAPTQAPYTGPQNVTPYPGCAAALKCVPDNYCTLEGVMSDKPVFLTKELLLSRVPLSECLDVATGIIGKCCRDPNYKDPWPDHDSHDHGHDHGHDHSHEHIEQTQAPQTQFTIKKPIGGYQTKPGPFVNLQQPSTIKVISLQSYSPSTEASKPIPSYSSQSSGYQYPEAPSQGYILPKPAPAQIYVPPVQPTYVPPPPPQPTYAPPPQSSYIPPPQPTYVPPPQSSYVPPPKPTYVPPPPSSYVPPKPVASYVPPPQPVATYVPPAQPQPLDVTYYKPATLSRLPLEPPVVIASDRVFEKSTIIAPFIEKEREYFSQCGVKANDGTEFGEAPWHAVVYSSRNKDLSCGGAIVSENAILTSAHCLEKADSDSLYVKVGPASQLHKVVTLARHPQYDSASLSKDLALAILKEPIKFDTYTQKICLPPLQTQVQSYNKQCYVSTLSDQLNPGTVQKIKVQTFPYQDCEIKLRNTYLGKYFVLQDTFTCASTPNDAELCQIKSGEPVVCDRGDGVFELYGIKSWDLGCQEYKKSAIFSNNDVLWIENTLVAPLQKLITVEQIYQKEKFKGETLEGLNFQEKPGFALGYGK